MEAAANPYAYKDDNTRCLVTRECTDEAYSTALEQKRADEEARKAAEEEEKRRAEEEAAANSSDSNGETSSPSTGSNSNGTSGTDGTITDKDGKECSKEHYNPHSLKCNN